MPKFFVSYHLEIEAENAESAAETTLGVIRDPSSTALVFEVSAENDESVESVEVDLAARRVVPVPRRVKLRVVE